MKKYTKIALTLAIIGTVPVLINSCSPRRAQQIAANYLKNLDTTPTNAGVDANNNGIRDDIDRIINEYPNTSTAEKNAMRQDAKVHQMIQVEMAKGPLTRQKKDEISNLMDNSIGCIAYRINDFDKRREIVRLAESLTHNTDKRAEAYINFNKSMGGTITTLNPLDETCIN
jgi:hypothetical protein